MTVDAEAVRPDVPSSRIPPIVDVDAHIVEPAICGARAAGKVPGGGSAGEVPTLGQAQARRRQLRGGAGRGGP